MKPSITPFGNDLVTLRPLAMDDLAATLAWRNRDETRRWFKHSAVLSADHHLDWFRQYEQRGDDFIFIVSRGDEPVGQVAIYDIDRAAGRAEIGRFIAAPGHEGRGLMKAAIAVLMKWAHAELGLSVLFLDVFESNERAIALYRASGFEEVGREGGLLKMECRLPC